MNIFSFKFGTSMIMHSLLSFILVSKNSLRNLFILNRQFCTLSPSSNLKDFCNFQDDDVAAVKEGSLSIHRLRRSLDESHSREIITLKMEIQQIMKGIVILWSIQC
jgi:hypothetical protein